MPKLPTKKGSKLMGKATSQRPVDPVVARLSEVDDLLQSAIDEPYNRGEVGRNLQFEEGEKIICLSKNLYYSGLLKFYYQLSTKKTTSSIEIGPEVPVVERRIPTCIIEYYGWGPKYDEEIAENELISRRRDSPQSVLGMLFAHEWNDYHRERMGKTVPEMGASVWFLDPGYYNVLHEMWLGHSGETRSFPEFCGRPRRTMPVPLPASLVVDHPTGPHAP